MMDFTPDNVVTRQAIVELASRIETTFDRGEHMSFGAETLLFESPHMGSFYAHETYRAGLRRFYDDLKNKGGTRHLMTNYEFDALGDGEARVRSYLTVLNRKSEQIAGVGEWRDVVRRTAAGWRFAERRQIV